MNFCKNWPWNNWRDLIVISVLVVDELQMVCMMVEDNVTCWMFSGSSVGSDRIIFWTIVSSLDEHFYKQPNENLFRHILYRENNTFAYQTDQYVCIKWFLFCKESLQKINPCNKMILNNQLIKPQLCITIFVVDFSNSFLISEFKSCENEIPLQRRPLPWLTIITKFIWQSLVSLFCYT